MLKDCMDGLPNLGGAVLLKDPRTQPQSKANQALNGRVYLVNAWDGNRHIGAFMHEGSIVMNQLGWGVKDSVKIEMRDGVPNTLENNGKFVSEIIFIGDIKATMQLVNAPAWWNERPRA